MSLRATPISRRFYLGLREKRMKPSWCEPRSWLRSAHKVFTCFYRRASRDSVHENILIRCDFVVNIFGADCVHPRRTMKRSSKVQPSIFFTFWRKFLGWLPRFIGLCRCPRWISREISSAGEIETFFGGVIRMREKSIFLGTTSSLHTCLARPIFHDVKLIARDLGRDIA